MRKTIPLMLVALGIPTAATAETDAELKALLIGSWGSAQGCEAAVLTFNEDGTFLADEDGPGPRDPDRGTYEIVDGKLSGATEDRTMPTVTLLVEDGEMFFVSESGRREQLIRC